MKKLATYGLLMAILFGNSGAGCSSNTDNPTPQPDSFTSLLGRWELKEANVYAQDAGMPQRLLGKSGEGLAYSFYADGSYDGCILSGSDWDNASQSGTTGNWNCTTNKPGRWALKVTRVQGKDIDDGTLTLTAPTLPKPFVLEKLFVGSATSGSTTVTVLVGESPTETDASGNTSWATYHFVKK
ncbi:MULTISPECIES: hypothetical protein [unclassified Spirosoma]|uniref:hypothetical protein n=1 Tax=unclassified Spirosoma TaxID=2621999 RepID=UPI00095A188D|nr:MULTISPECIES: hypothetical protein [unclassified Spirosoma]MBN8825192.1 hypothetical protein [Spirosoma sp.]OJW77128.1 MAG: hypothetical protein BGO59_31165 [Spirosoma sp. 48-14]